MRFILINLIVFVFFHFSSLQAQVEKDTTDICEYSVDLFDSQRDRIIPIAVYSPLTVNRNEVIVFNHGYGGNKGGAYKMYSHITRKLAEEGYFIISIQHELITDDFLAMGGDLYTNRLPNWERGVENILFSIREFKKLKPELNWEKISVIGHSNGGDMTMLLAREYPHIISKAISLDNRRMPLPRVSVPQIYSLRGSDYPADEGVLPLEKEQEEFNMRIVASDIKHTEMDDKASDSQSQLITDYLLNFLKE